jgi:hypothetical protein
LATRATTGTLSALTSTVACGFATMLQDFSRWADGDRRRRPLGGADPWAALTDFFEQALTGCARHRATDEIDTACRVSSPVTCRSWPTCRFAGLSHGVATRSVSSAWPFPTPLCRMSPLRDRRRPLEPDLNERAPPGGRSATPRRDRHSPLRARRAGPGRAGQSGALPRPKPGRTTLPSGQLNGRGRSAKGRPSRCFHHRQATCLGDHRWPTDARAPNRGTQPGRHPPGGQHTSRRAGTRRGRHRRHRRRDAQWEHRLDLRARSPHRYYRRRRS